MGMTAVFIEILNMSLTAGYCIVVVIALRFLLRRQAKILSYLLWSVVLFRLLCPFSFTSNYSLLRMNTAAVSQEGFAGAGEAAEMVWQGKGYLFDETQGEAGNIETAPVSLTETGVSEQAAGWQRAVLLGSRIWLAGIVALFGYSFWSAFRFRRFLSRAVLSEEGVYEAEGIATPFVFGVVRPKIYLPPHLQPQERQYVLEHERVHIARRDYLMKLLFWGAVCLHWFNPLVWLAFVLMERDMEMSCDEAVLRRFGKDAKREYSLALLQLSCEEGRFGSSPLAFGEGNVRSRIQNVLGWRRRGIAVMVTLAVLLGVVAIGLSLNPTGLEAEEEARREFVSAYANAYCNRDGNALVNMYANKWKAYESLPMLDKEGEVYTFGMSSPWPNEFRFVLHEYETEMESSAEIWYYAWTSDPHVTVWKERIRIFRLEPGEEGGYRVISSGLRYLDSISTKTEFDEAYLIGGEYQFTDYTERGFLEGILAQTAYDRENGDADRNAAYRDPVTAAAWIFNLTGGEGTVLTDASQRQAIVEYLFADGSSVEIPMYNARYGTAGTEETQVSEDIWLPDLGVWNANAP